MTTELIVNVDLDFCICGGFEKSRFEWLQNEELTVSLLSFWFY